MPHAIAPDGLHCSRLEFRRELLLSSHGHTQSMLCLLQSGELEQAGPDLRLHPGGIRLAPVGVAANLRLAATTRLTLVDCEIDGMVGRHPFWRSMTAGVLLAPDTAVNRVAAALQRPVGPGGLSFVAEDAMLRLLATEYRRVAGREVRPLPAPFANILHAILTAPAAPMRLGDLARQAGTNRIQLGRWSREWLGRPLGHFVVSARLDLARRCLLDRVQPLAGVAQRAGFCDQSHLNRAFRQRFGHSPGRFRRLYQASKTGPAASAIIR